MSSGDVRYWHLADMATRMRQERRDAMSDFHEVVVFAEILDTGHIDIPLEAIVCHCSFCQLRTGAAFWHGGPSPPTMWSHRFAPKNIRAQVRRTWSLAADKFLPAMWKQHWRDCSTTAGSAGAERRHFR